MPASLAITVDLDSTIADTRQRRHVLDGRPKREPADWVAYSMACSSDVLIESTARIVRTFAETHQVFFVSGRNEEARDLTVAWLAKHDIPYDALYLKPVGWEWASQGEYKLDTIRALEAEHRVKVVLHLDDWLDVTAHLEAHGIPALHVVPPGFNVVPTGFNEPPLGFKTQTEAL
jgi:predicted secreted acid phosphatase